MITLSYFMLAIGLFLVFAGGAFVGVGLGRRSKTANAYTDRILEESKELRERLEAAKAKLKARGE